MGVSLVYVHVLCVMVVYNVKYQLSSADTTEKRRE